MDRCESCRFWRKLRENEQDGVMYEIRQIAGTCRVAAPFRLMQNHQYPVVLPDDWCGEYQPEGAGDGIQAS